MSRSKPFQAHLFVSRAKPFHVKPPHTHTLSPEAVSGHYARPAAQCVVGHVVRFPKMFAHGKRTPPIGRA
eukprot:3303356-Prymnesium_polylepis.1